MGLPFWPKNMGKLPLCNTRSSNNGHRNRKGEKKKIGKAKEEEEEVEKKVIHWPRAVTSHKRIRSSASAQFFPFNPPPPWRVLVLCAPSLCCMSALSGVELLFPLSATAFSDWKNDWWEFFFFFVFVVVVVNVGLARKRQEDEDRLQQREALLSVRSSHAPASTWSSTPLRSTLPPPLLLSCACQLQQRTRFCSLPSASIALRFFRWNRLS